MLWRVVIVELTSTVISPLRALKNSAETSSVQPSMSWVSALPSSSAQRLLGYLFWIWGRFWQHMRTCSERERIVLNRRERSGITPMLFISSRTMFTGTAHRCSGVLSAYRTKRINRKAKKSDDRNSREEFWSSRMMK